MKFEVLSKDDNLNVLNGSYLQGYVNASYADLVRVFGKPTDDGDAYKTDAEWVIVFEDGAIATIYNYKDGRNYNGPNGGLYVEEITDWHIGGFHSIVVDRITEILK